MPGFVDEVSQEVVRGWYVADDRQRACRGVVISINGEERYCALCQDERLDVVAAGIAIRADVGFLAPLALQIGDLVHVRALDNGRLLNDGLAIVMPYGASDGFLDAMRYADLPAFRDLIEPLRPHLDIQAFRPLFGHRGKLSALCIETAGRRIVHCQRPRHNAVWLERLHRQVLEPNAIAAPSLKAVIDHGDTASLVVAHVEGQTLGPFVDGAESVFQDTIASVTRLSSLACSVDAAIETEVDKKIETAVVKKEGRRGRRAFDKLIRSVCLTALKQRRWQELRLLLKMTQAVYQLPHVFSHGDLHPQNVLIETHTGDPIFIDWDHADKLPIGFDLSRLLISVPPALAESWIDRAQETAACQESQSSRDCRLGWLIMSYFARSQREPDFHATEDGAYLRRRFSELAKRSGHKSETMSQIQ